MEIAITILGLSAAAATAGANLPQIVKCYRTKRAGELSGKTLAILAGGFAGWLAYGVFQNDVVIVVANIASIAQVATLLLMKRWYSAAARGPQSRSKRHYRSGRTEAAH